jgi:TPR repeat protein
MKKTLLLASFVSLLSITSVFANDELIKMAESGNAEAQFKLAAMYASGKLGNKTPEDREKMFGWLEKAASQDFLKAQEILCKQYLDRGKYPDALKWAKRAVVKNSNVGKSVMAYLLYYGYNVIPINKTKAYSLIKECPKEALSKALLGEFYMEGWFDFEKNLDKAEELAREAIKDGCSKGYELLGEIYMKRFTAGKEEETLAKLRECIDEGLKKNNFSRELNLSKAMYQIMLSNSEEEHKKGIELLEQSAKNNDKGAYAILSDYELMNNNPKKALEYMEKAAEDYCSNTPYEFLDLCLMGENSKGLKTDVNPKKAREIAEKTIPFNNENFLEKYIVIYQMAKRNAEFKKLYGEAFLDNFDCDKYIKIAADNGSSSMAYFYAKTLTGTNFDEKMKYLTASANMGWADAQSELAAEYFGKQDFEKTIYWAKKAADNNHWLGVFLYGQCLFSGLGNTPMDESKGFQLILRSITFGGDCKAVRIAFRRFVNQNNHFLVYLLGQIYLNGFSPKETNETIDEIKAEVSKAKNSLSKDDIEKADDTLRKYIEQNTKALKVLSKNNLINYGVINF